MGIGSGGKRKAFRGVMLERVGVGLAEGIAWGCGVIEHRWYGGKEGQLET